MAYCINFLVPWTVYEEHIAVCHNIKKTGQSKTCSDIQAEFSRPNLGSLLMIWPKPTKYS